MPNNDYLILRKCPFCGGKAAIVCCDDEGNIHGDDYENDTWSGLGYQIRHSHEENEDCPIATYVEDGAIMGGVYIYDTRAGSNRSMEQEGR